MSQLPPFRTRRSEPVLHLDDPAEPNVPTLTDDDVPVLTQVVNAAAPTTPNTPAAASAEAGPASLSSVEIDDIVDDVMAELLPELESLVRQALLRRLS